RDLHSFPTRRSSDLAWAWIGLAEAAGVDMPYISWRLATGHRARPQRGRPGAVWMHVARDLASAARHAMAGKLGLAEYCACWRRPRSPGTIPCPAFSSFRWRSTAV